MRNINIYLPTKKVRCQFKHIKRLTRTWRKVPTMCASMHSINYVTFSSLADVLHFTWISFMKCSAKLNQEIEKETLFFLFVTWLRLSIDRLYRVLFIIIECERIIIKLNDAKPKQPNMCIRIHNYEILYRFALVNLSVLGMGKSYFTFIFFLLLFETIRANLNPQIIINSSVYRRIMCASPGFLWFNNFVLFLFFFTHFILTCLHVRSRHIRIAKHLICPEKCVPSETDFEQNVFDGIT